jgi:hypothetical protein
MLPVVIALRFCHAAAIVGFLAVGLRWQQRRSWFVAGAKQDSSSDCTLSATLVSQGVACLRDGKHEASREGRNERRVVYRIGTVIMKLCVDTSKQLEAACLKRTRNLEQTPRLLLEGKCVIESKQCGSSHVNCITQTVSCLLMTYVGPSFDMLMHRFFGNPYDVTVANFFVSAYQELGLMCISGNICCSIRALRYCSVFWSHDRCIISTSR